MTAILLATFSEPLTVDLRLFLLLFGVGALLLMLREVFRDWRDGR